ncbi:MAG: DUF1854 domain-containing protein [Myxococcales bacterium]|nr:DUF1854 domain-containing protein [Myxococcales bacterium]
MNRSFRIERSPNHRWVLIRPGLPDETDIRVVRAFPWTHPTGFVSIRSEDNKELIFIEDPNTLDEAQQHMLQEAMAESWLVPVIQRVVNVNPRKRQWIVVTDRGPTEIEMQDRQDVHPLPDGRYIIRDLYGNTHILPQLHTLDRVSRRMAHEMI